MALHPECKTLEKVTENGKDIYLDDQSEETKKALIKLFNVNEK